MSIINRIADAYRAFASPAAPVSEPTAIAPTETKDAGTFSFPSSTLTYALGLWPSNTGVPISPIAALQAAAVYSCIKRLAEDISKTPIKVRRRSRKGGWIDAVDHPLTGLFRRPNYWQTQFEWLSYMVTSLQMRGNSYLYVDRRSDGFPRRLVPLLPERTAVMLTYEGELYYKITAPLLGQETITVTPFDMIHIRNISLDGGLMGVSPIACSQDGIGLALASQRHAALFYRQGTSLNGTLEAPNRLSREAAIRLAQSWQDNYSGSDNHHRVAVLEEGMKFNPISISPEDAQLVEAQRWSAEQICRVFGVPPWLVGLPVPTGTYSNVEQSQQSYVQNTLLGLARKIEQELERVLLFDDERDSYQIAFDFDAILRGDLKSRMEAMQIALLNGVLSINEVREREGLEAIEGGDEHRVPLNTGPAAKKPTDTAPEAPVGSPQAQEQAT